MAEPPPSSPNVTFNNSPRSDSARARSRLSQVLDESYGPEVTNEDMQRPHQRVGSLPPTSPTYRNTLSFSGSGSGSGGSSSSGSNRQNLGLSYSSPFDSSSLSSGSNSDPRSRGPLDFDTSFGSSLDSFNMSGGNPNPNPNGTYNGSPQQSLNGTYNLPPPPPPLPPQGYYPGPNYAPPQQLSTAPAPAEPDSFLTHVHDYTKDQLRLLMLELAQELPPLVDVAVRDAIKKAVSPKMVLDVGGVGTMQAGGPYMLQGRLQKFVNNSVDNVLNVYLGPRTLQELFPKMAAQQLGCAKPCRCPRNRGPNGLPLDRKMCGLDDLSAPACQPAKPCPTGQCGGGRGGCPHGGCPDFDNLVAEVNNRSQQP